MACQPSSIARANRSGKSGQPARHDRPARMWHPSGGLPRSGASAVIARQRKHDGAWSHTSQRMWIRTHAHDGGQHRTTPQRTQHVVWQRLSRSYSPSPTNTCLCVPNQDYSSTSTAWPPIVTLAPSPGAPLAGRYTLTVAPAPVLPEMASLSPKVSGTLRASNHLIVSTSA
jgi:hypothetical protein